MIKINIECGEDRKTTSQIAYEINSALVGSRCFIENEVVVPSPYYDAEKNTNIQEIIIGDNNDKDIEINVTSFTKEEI
jgi:hypothetical protein